MRQLLCTQVSPHLSVNLQFIYRSLLKHSWTLQSWDFWQLLIVMF
jgi:hypothetical protein